MSISKKTSLPKVVLHLEGLIVLTGSLFAYNYINGSWLLFVLLFLVPDASMVGYFVKKRVGAIIYNSVHNYILAGFCMFLGYIISNFLLFEIGIILAAHVGMDRMLGFGLKYPTNFKDTHMQKV